MDVTGGLLNGIIAKAGDVWKWLTGVPGTIVSSIGKLGGTLFQAGKDLLQGLWDGLTSKWKDVSKWLGDRANDAKNIWKTITRQQSPSLDFIDIGLNMMLGLEQGLQRGHRSAQSFNISAARSMAPAFAGAAGSVGGTGGSDSMSRFERETLATLKDIQASLKPPSGTGIEADLYRLYRRTLSTRRRGMVGRN
jgi:hypothetical protein